MAMKAATDVFFRKARRLTSDEFFFLFMIEFPASCHQARPNQP
jgi:hypothetical protein